MGKHFSVYEKLCCLDDVRMFIFSLFCKEKAISHNLASLRPNMFVVSESTTGMDKLTSQV